MYYTVPLADLCKNGKKSANPGGNGPALTAGTLGVTTGVMVGCLVAVAPELEAGVEFLSEPADGLESGVDEGPEAGVRTGVSEPDCPSLPSAGAEPLLEDAEERIQHHGELAVDSQTRTG